MANDPYPYQPPTGAPLTRGPAAALLWGAFLGCSWTWVIGMIFPALLLRDYGLVGWLVFAIPNVLGAAMMGAVLYNPDRSVRIVKTHARACHHFTVATVAFQLFVAVWLFTALFGVATMPLLVVAIGLFASLGLRNRATAMLLLAAGLAVVSWGCFSYGVRADQAWGLADWALPTDGVNRLTQRDLLFFAPCAFVGFALCPYLDLTFHRARINTTPGTGVAAFFFGFGVVFASMIVFSICYGSLLLPFIQGDPDAQLPGLWLILLGTHLTLQAGFTITVHVRESIENPKANTRWLAIASMLAILLAIAARLTGLPDSPLTGDLTWGEAGYRGFLLLYGTVFPGYVWLIMIPPLRGPLTKQAIKLRSALFAGTCIVTYALGWTAFVLGHSVALAYLVGVFVLIRGIIELLPSDRPANKSPI